MMKNYFSRKEVCFTLFLSLGLVLSELKGQTIQTFTYTGAMQTFVVPSCVGTITITAKGAQGAPGVGGVTGTGGLGGVASGVINVSQGQVLNIYVGGQNGFNGGGVAGVSGPNTSGNGGDASDVRFGGVALTDRVVIGGGGGGGTGGPQGSCTNGPGADGGAGGNAAGGTGTTGNGCGSGGTGGTGGSQVSGGVGGLGNTNCQGPAGNGLVGLSGIGGDGGAGVIGCGGFTGSGGGGGGGGYYGGAGGGGGNGGGGGAWAGGGGGGGSSYVDAVLTNPSYTTGTQSGNGEVILAYTFTSPGVGVTLSNPFGICPGGTSILTASGMVTYTWSNGSNGTSIAVSPNTTTTYTVSGTNSIGCLLTNAVTVTVNPLPTLSVTSTNTFLCVGQTANLTGLGANTYTWNNGSTTITGSNVPVSPTVSTNYTVTGESLANCVNAIEYMVNVHPYLLSTSANTAICEGTSVVLTASGVVSQQWSTGSPFASITVAPPTSTLYTVTSVDANNCTATNSIAVTVNPNPTITASTSKTIVCKGSVITLSAQGAPTFSWSTGSSASTTTVMPLLDTQYSYTVTGTDVNGCVNKTVITLKAELCTGLNDLSSAGNRVTVFPNPGNGQFTISTEKMLENGVVQVYTVSGTLIGTFPLSGEPTSVDLHDAANGVYLIHVIENQKPVFVTKVVKQ